MRKFTLVLLLFAMLGSLGCMISTQEGERSHVNAPPPDEITFHFDTSFNKTMLFGRSAALLLVALWAFFSRGKGGSNALLLVIAALGLVGSGWLLKAGWSTVFDYRIEIRDELLHLGIPSTPELDIRWNEIESVEGEGIAVDVTFGDGKGQALKWAPEWENMTITLKDGRKRDVDLRPLSVEQRGTLWRAIARKAEFGVEEWVETDKS